MNEDEDCCINCVYFKQSNEHGGCCRRFPPQGSKSCYPTVTQDFWCGEWEPDLVKIGLQVLGDE